MEKAKLNRFISKYFLNGNIESVIWNCGENLSVKFVDDSKSLIGEVIYEKSEFPQSQFGVNQTSRLRSLLGVVGDTIDIEIKKKDDIANQMKISDSNVEVNYILSDMSIIPKVPTSKGFPHWELVLDIDEKFIDNFVKASNALNDVKEFAILTKDEKVSFVIGHSNINTTKVAINVEPKKFEDILDAVYFNTTHLKEILTSNKDAKTGKIEISSKGLMRVQFHSEGFKSTYFLVSKQDIDN